MPSLSKTLLVLLLLLFLGSARTVPAMTTNELQGEIELLKKQVEKLKEEKNLADAQRALDAAKAGPDTPNKALLESKARDEARRDAAKASYDAWEAETIGTVKAGSFSGAVTKEADTGKAEAALLAADALRIAATRIAARIPEDSKRIEVFAAAEFPDFQRLAGFRFQRELVRQAYGQVGIQPATVGPGVTASAVAAPAAISAGLEALSKILGFFKTDYTVGGVAVTMTESALVNAVAGELATKKVQVRVPRLFVPTARDGAVRGLVGLLMELQGLRVQATEAVEAKGEEAQRLEDQAKALPDGAAKEAKQKAAAALRSEVAAIEGVIKMHEAFVASLTVPDGKTGALPAAALAFELAFEEALKNQADILLLRLESAGGGYLIKKNLWTGLGSIPLYHMGGATVSFLLLAGAEGTVKGGGVVPVHGGFIRAGRMQQHLDR